MVSLKAYIADLALLLGMTPAALYERQRALVRAGWLRQGDGRGPGSGVRADALTVAWLLISVMATGSLSEASTRAYEIAATKTKKGLLPIPHAKSFQHALEAILAEQTLAQRVVQVRVFQSSPHATIIWRQGNVQMNQDFSGTSRPSPPLRTIVEMDGNVLSRIAKDFQDAASEPVLGVKVRSRNRPSQIMHKQVAPEKETP